MKERYLAIICFSILIVIITAGLWPFNFHPENSVKWSEHERGLRFRHWGIAYSSTAPAGAFRNLFHKGSFSIELWVRPKFEPTYNVSRILSFFDGSETELFGLSQWKSNLEIVRNIMVDASKPPKGSNIGVWDALLKGRKQFITVTSDTGGTEVYINGEIAQSFPGYAVAPQSFASFQQIVLGNSPTGTQSWNGTVYGLALYKEPLSPEQVMNNYAAWSQDRLSLLFNDEGIVALYLFDENHGPIVHNRAGNYLHLEVPETFQILKKSILVPPWRDFTLTRSYLSDILINIIGFIPLGFFFSLYLERKGVPSNKILWIVILIGGAVSLSIEIVQIYLPGRSSQLMDVIDNILGSHLGVILFKLAQKIRTLLHPAGANSETH